MIKCQFVLKSGKECGKICTFADTNFPFCFKHRLLHKEENEEEPKSNDKLLWIIDSDVEFEDEKDEIQIGECSKCRVERCVRKVKGFDVRLCLKCTFKEVGCNGCQGRLIQFFPKDQWNQVE